MATESGPVCSRCKVTSSLIWKRDNDGSIICLDCQTSEKAAKQIPPWKGEGEPHITGKASSSTKPVGQSSTAQQPEQSVPVSGVATRRTTRSHERAKVRQQQQQQKQGSVEAVALVPAPTPTTTAVQPSTTVSKGPVPSPSSVPQIVETLDSPSPAPSASDHNTAPSRRSLKQGQAVHAAEQGPYTVTSDSIQHKGCVFEVGDVVSVLDRDGGVYYAVVQGFLFDQYADKHVLLTWLLPKAPNPTHFDPAMFILGPEDDTPRSMEHIDFVCHSPQSRHFQGSYLQNIGQAELWLTAN